MITQKVVLLITVLATGDTHRIPWPDHLFCNSYAEAQNIIHEGTYKFTCRLIIKDSEIKAEQEAKL